MSIVTKRHKMTQNEKRSVRRRGTVTKRPHSQFPHWKYLKEVGGICLSTCGLVMAVAGNPLFFCVVQGVADIDQLYCKVAGY